MFGLLGKVFPESPVFAEPPFLCFHLDLLDNLWDCQWVRSAAGTEANWIWGDSDLVGAPSLSEARRESVVS